MSETQPIYNGAEGAAVPAKPKREAPMLPPATFVLRGDDEPIWANLRRVLNRWLQGGPVQVRLSQYQPEHSDPQRALFWSWCGIHAKAMREAGQPCCDEAVHDEVLEIIFGREELGYSRTRPRRSLTRPRRMSKLEMMEVLSTFEVWSAERGVMLPRPETWDADVEAAEKSA